MLKWATTFKVKIFLNKIISRDVYCLYVSSFLTCHIAILALQKKVIYCFVLKNKTSVFDFWKRKLAQSFPLYFLVLKYVCTTARVRLRTWIIFHNSLHILEEITKMKSMKIYKCMIRILRRILLLHILSLHITTFLSRYVNKCVYAY